MVDEHMTRTGGQLLVECLHRHGVDQAFGVPGESYLAALDALYDRPEIRLVTCRQEGGAAMMAEAYGKLTGRPGICFVTRGPGATNASAGLHVARQDSTPLLLLIGQVGRGMQDREAFQEIDYRQMYGPLSKWVAQIDDPGRIPEYISRAFHVATSGRPGPVVLALPEDMLRQSTTAGPGRPWRPLPIYPGSAQLALFRDLLAGAERPLVLLGEGGWDAAGWADLQAFCSASQLPVATTFRCQDLFDNTHPCYVGDLGLGANPALVRQVREADLIVALGGRLGEIPSAGYTLFDIPVPRQCLIHVHPAAEELGRVYSPELAINAGLTEFAEALMDVEPIEPVPWAAITTHARQAYRQWIEPQEEPGDLQLGRIVRWLCQRLPPEAIVTNGAGNYAGWVHRFYQYRQLRTQLAPRSGSMGYGLPAAVAAKLTEPERPVICFAGDGCLQMTVQEFATAVQFEAAIVVLVVNNGTWGTIRMHQERQYPDRVKGTVLVNPDFAALARAYGGFGIRVERYAEFPAAFEQAQAAGRPALIELCQPLEALTPAASLDTIRARARASQS